MSHLYSAITRKNKLPILSTDHVRIPRAMEIYDHSMEPDYVSKLQPDEAKTIIQNTSQVSVSSVPENVTYGLSQKSRYRYSDAYNICDEDAVTTRAEEVKKQTPKQEKMSSMINNQNKKLKLNSCVGKPPASLSIRRRIPSGTVKLVSTGTQTNPKLLSPKISES